MITLLKKCVLIVILSILSISSYAKSSPFIVELQAGSARFPTQTGLNGAPSEYTFIITNPNSFDIPNITYYIPRYFVTNIVNSTCTGNLNKNSSCRISLTFRPNKIGSFTGEFKVCGANGIWCSKFPTPLTVGVTQNYIVSTNCDDIVSRPFGSLTCSGSRQFADNFGLYMAKVLGTSAIHSEFYYYQHQPSVNETTINCLESRQENVGLDENILGGGTPLCKLMGYADTTASPTNQSSDSELAMLYPPFLNFLVGTGFPLTGSTQPLGELDALLDDFGTSSMNNLVQNAGATGYINFFNDYFLQQLTTAFDTCGITNTCPAISYIPYKVDNGENILQTWPLTSISFNGISGGGGSGAGTQILAFKPGSTTHYTLFSNGGGGGGGNTNPEISGITTYLINAGSGGGGGSQFGDCYIRDNVRLTGLGLGAGAGSGLSTAEGTTVTYPGVSSPTFSYLAPTLFPSWSDSTILTEYGSNLTFLLETQIPELYALGYTIIISGGGGGGAGLEFLNSNYEEYNPHPVSIGHGFNFCYAFNKDGIYSSTDCIPSTNVNSSSLTVNEIIYNNIGPLFHQGMKQAILPENCGGYQNSICTCNYQHDYVIENLGAILVASGFSIADIPTWLNNPHCNQGQSALALHSILMTKPDQNNKLEGTLYKGKISPSDILQSFYQAKSSLTCSPPWS
ncbi:MAG: hypothetical protein P1U74_08860 [Legionellaceae bacterium]|nr:hypothetical protein [Legionellaceae bacterium]